MSVSAPEAPVVEAVSDGFMLSGPVTIATASAVVDAMRPHWPEEGDAVVDFEGVTEADSAALALMFKWQRDSGRKGRKVVCRNIPANVLALARLYGVEELVSQQ
jgi:phospholipid transport system transporter-binding protein